MAHPSDREPLFPLELLAASIPKVPTNRALLVLDLQNDFVKPDGKLFVRNTPEFLDKVASLARDFRDGGYVYWVQTVNEGLKTGQSSIFLGEKGVAKGTTGALEVEGRAEDGDDSDVEASKLSARTPPRAKGRAQSSCPNPEAFLGVASSRCCLPKSPGAQFPAAILSAIDRSRDTVLVKSDYSPFQTEDFLLSSRKRFITKLYICGSLSNVSVYATVMDAVPHGFSITLIEDCLGFRDYSVHFKAMEEMAGKHGASGITAAELQQENDQEQAERPAEGPPSKVERAGIESTMGALNMQNSQTPKNTSLASPSPSGSSQKKSKKPHNTTLGPGDKIGEGDSRVIYDLDLIPNTFDLLRSEVNWQKMYHMSGQVPRLVAVQGSVQPDGSIPIYRHPADESPPLLPFSPTVDMIRGVVEEKLGHPINHVLIQLYRDGQDRISEHSDKTLDIVRGSYICNVSLGAQRTMTLRTKISAKSTSAAPDREPGRQSQRIPLPHNSLFVLGEETNMRWLHGIRADKRPESTKSFEERAFKGERISLTFRQIGTFINPETDTIWGQGAVSRSKENAGKILHGKGPETERMIRAFGTENHATEFDWAGYYGAGFDVMNFVTTATAKFVPSGDEVEDLRVRLCLTENGVRYDVFELDELPVDAKNAVKSQPGPILLDSDGTTCTAGTTNILTHIGRHRRAQDTPDPGALLNTEDLPTRLVAIDSLLDAARTDPKSVPDHLPRFESALQGKTYLPDPGTVFGIDDCALWPVLRYIVEKGGEGNVFEGRKWPGLEAYYGKVGRRVCVKNVLGEMDEESKA